MSKFAILIALSVATAAPASAEATNPFECRAADPILPQLEILRTAEDRGFGERSFTYEADGQRVFGLPAKYLKHVRTRNGETGLNEFDYTAVVDGNLDLVRWLFERTNPSMRCSRNGGEYSCLMVAEIGKNGGGYHKIRRASIRQASNEASLDYASGIVVNCSWMENPTR